MHNRKRQKHKLNAILFPSDTARADIILCERPSWDRRRENCDATGRHKNVSAHQNWLAMDLVIVSDDGYNLKWSSEKYKIVGEIWENMGIGHIWGGRWTEPRDPYHFEMRGE